MNDRTSRAVAVLFARALLGIIFLMQGYGKVFTFTVPKVYDMFFKDFEKTFLPKWLIWGTAYYTSYVELICGFLLIIGLFRKYALCLLAVDLLVVSFGHGLYGADMGPAACDTQGHFIDCYPGYPFAMGQVEPG